MDVKKAFPSKFLKASDLDGAARTVTISHVKTEEVGQTKDRKLVVYFKGKSKGLVLNKTNCNKIVSITGEGDTDDWKGRVIAIYPTETEFQGETVECIRVKAAKTGSEKIKGMEKRASEPEPEPEPEREPGSDDLSDEEIPW